MIPLTVSLSIALSGSSASQYQPWFQWGRSEVVIIYPDKYKYIYNTQITDIYRSYCMNQLEQLGLHWFISSEWPLWIMELAKPRNMISACHAHWVMILMIRGETNNPRISRRKQWPQGFKTDRRSLSSTFQAFGLLRLIAPQSFFQTICLSGFEHAWHRASAVGGWLVLVGG